jgi:hypothetical protein
VRPSSAAVRLPFVRRSPSAVPRGIGSLLGCGCVAGPRVLTHAPRRADQGIPAAVRGRSVRAPAVGRSASAALEAPPGPGPGPAGWGRSGPARWAACRAGSATGRGQGGSERAEGGRRLRRHGGARSWRARTHPDRRSDLGMRRRPRWAPSPAREVCGAGEPCRQAIDGAPRLLSSDPDGRTAHGGSDRPHARRGSDGSSGSLPPVPSRPTVT